MRDIKFRAFDGEEMIFLPMAGLQYFDFEGSYALSFVVDGYRGFWGHENYNGQSQIAKGFPIMQYTGLKDKNGVEIYEGDILKYHSGCGTLRKVVYKSGGFHSVTLDEEPGSPNHPIYFLTLAPTGTSQIEVIGNIHQNAELLK